MNIASVHTPVMLQEVLDYFNPQPNQFYLDATLGAGGHTLAILKHGASVDALDRDQEIIDLAKTRIQDAGLSQLFHAYQGSFADLLQNNSSSPLKTNYQGILFDLGVSSLQLDKPERGFSFRFDAPLDMRMDPQHQAVTAKDLVNGLGRKELTNLFSELGDEPFAHKIANKICDVRKQTPIITTKQLANLVESVVKRHGHIHPATKVFQALRMAVNTERDELKRALPLALSRLKLKGVLIVISFHSGEDSLVKSQFNQWSKSGLVEILTNSVKPSEAEVKHNPRSRSAVMRVVRRLK